MSAGDITYRLVVDMATTGSLGAGAEKLGKTSSSLDSTLKSVGGSIGSIGSGLADAFTGAVEKAGALAVSLGKAAAVGGAAAIGYGVAKLNADLEDTQISLAGILNAQGMSNGLEDAMDRSGKVMKEMRKDAAALPGEFKDLINIFRMAATPAFQSGASIDQVEKLSASAMAAAAALKMPMDQAAREMAQLLQGHAGGHNVFGSLLGFTGDDAKKFNAMGGDKRFAEVEKHLAKYSGLNKVFEQSFSAASSTLIDNAKQFTTASTAGLFEKVKGTMRDANAWFDANGPLVNSWSTHISDRLAHGFDRVKGFIIEWFPPMRAFAGEVEDRIVGAWHKIEPIVERIAGKLGNAIKNPAEGLAGLGMVGGLYGAAKLAPTAASGMSALGGAAGLGGAATAGVGALIAGLVVADFLSVTRVLTDSSSSMYATANDHWTNMKTQFSGALWHLGNAMDRLEPVGMKLADLYGNWVVGQLDRATWALEKFAYAIDTVTDGISKGIAKFSEKFDAMKELAGLKGGPELGKEGLGVISPERNGVSTEFLASRFGAAMANENAKNPQTKKHTGGGGTSIQKVEIVVSGNEDPDRVARLTAERLLAIARNPLRSDNPNPLNR